MGLLQASRLDRYRLLSDSTLPVVVTDGAILTNDRGPPIMIFTQPQQEANPVMTVDFITQLFRRTDDAMRDVPKHAQALLYPSEIVTQRLCSS